jgi:hypothetical protein
VLLSFILLPVRRRTTLEATLVAMPSTSAINHGNDTEDSAGALVFVDFVAIPYCVCEETNLMVTNDRIGRDHALATIIFSSLSGKKTINKQTSSFTEESISRKMMQRTGSLRIPREKDVILCGPTFSGKRELP